MANKHTPRKLELSGELTIFTASAIREQLLAALAGATEIEVDLARVTDVDTAGVQLMIAAKRQAGATGKRVGFTGHSATVLDTLDLCDLAAHLGDPVLIHSDH
jgi:anti-sigma B factor antagonist